MDRIASVWVLVSHDACRACNEPFGATPAEPEAMSKDIFLAIADTARRRSWKCTVVAGEGGVPEELRETCDRIAAEVMLPARYDGNWAPSRLAVVFESDQLDLSKRHSPSARAILRLRRADLPGLADMIGALFGRFRDVSIRHPEVLSYDAGDLRVYEQQLSEVGNSLLGKGKDWLGYRLDCLTGAFGPAAAEECAAGDTTLTVAPDGAFHLCHAAMLEGMPACGHVLEEVAIPDRRLMTRAYALLCKEKCAVQRCRRCVYLNKKATREFCVPPENLCRLRYAELAARAALAAKALAAGLWEQSWPLPEMPLIDDPWELITDESSRTLAADTWERLLRYSGDPRRLTPGVMLDMICALRGTVEAYADLVQAGVAPSDAMVEDSLAVLRRRTIERYRDSRFSQGCPSVAEIEAALRDKCMEILRPGGPNAE